MVWGQGDDTHSHQQTKQDVHAFILEVPFLMTGPSVSLSWIYSAIHEIYPHLDFDLPQWWGCSSVMFLLYSIVFHPSQFSVAGLIMDVKLSPAGWLSPCVVISTLFSFLFLILFQHSYQMLTSNVGLNAVGVTFLTLSVLAGVFRRHPYTTMVRCDYTLPSMRIMSSPSEIALDEKNPIFLVLEVWFTDLCFGPSSAKCV